ncbi:cytochrome c biogenesis protein CcmG, thiol:disulfide interchange protein DsbE [Rhizobiales bacterium GAS191]|nr:cytochrome c biogenesis protein CcmG, thiol:disulfide interchange protein DsbE [Rhizobiales bacterium GAS191]
MSDITAKPRRPFANPWLFAPLAVFLGLAALFLTRIGNDPSVLPSALIGEPAPAFTLPGLAGLTRDGVAVEGFSDADLKVQSGALINVFASWCVPCRAEHPVLMELAKDKSVMLLGLNHKDEAENARRFLGALGNPYRKVGVDGLGRTSLDFGIYGVPETFAIDSNGRIVGKHVGALTMADAQELLRQARGSR